MTGVVSLFLEREWADTRRNKRVLPLFFIMPVVAIIIPVIIALFAPQMSRAAEQNRDPQMALLLTSLARLPEFAGLSPLEALTRYLLRTTVGMFMFIPMAIASTAAAFSIVGEKQQRTLEPILATPITDRQLLLGKLLASAVPTVLLTWGSGAVAIVLVDLIAWSHHSGLLLPDRYWLVGLLILAPALAAACVLVTMRMSANSTDPQATVQATTLAILPGFVVLVGVFGKTLTRYFPALVWASAVIVLLDLALFRMNVARFRREEILTRWK